MKTIPLGGAKAAGRVALIDDDDYELVARHSWYIYERQRPGRSLGPYAATTVRREDGKRIMVYMHGLVTGWSRTDHVNHDGIDNQRRNLRPGPPLLNGHNRRPNLRSSSRFKGVTWRKQESRWTAQIRINGKLKHLGYFDDEAIAAKAYDEAASVAFGEYASLNFS